MRHRIYFRNIHDERSESRDFLRIFYKNHKSDWSVKVLKSEDLKKFFNKSEIRYFYDLKKMLNTVENLDIESLKIYLENNIKNRKEVSNLKNAIKLLQSRGVIEDEGYLSEIYKIHKLKPKHHRISEEQFKLLNTQNAINRMKNKRLKIAYRLQLISGLRISEISSLTSDDIEIDENNRLYIHVRHGKGDKYRLVECLPDVWVSEELKQLEERKEKLFYTKKYMMDIATKLNFHTHDLRKCYASIVFYNTIYNSVEKVQQSLGHSLGTRTYLKYITRDISFYQTRYHGKKNLTKLCNILND